MKNAASGTRNSIILVILMMGLWLLLSGHYDAFHVAMGVVSVALVFWLDRKLMRERFFPGAGKRPSLRIGYFHLSYFPWMVWQIIVAALQVAYVILSPGKSMNISLLRFRTNLPTNTSRVILGNSITLTPGTLTIDLTGGEFLVHALTDQSAAGIISSDMPDRVGKLYDSKAEKMVTELEVIRSADSL